MPAGLWSEAAGLAQVHGVYPVAHALRISFEGLKRRIAESTRGSKAIAEQPRAFVEMTGAELLGGPMVPGAVLELSDAAGMRLALRLTVGVEVDVAGVVGAFRQRQT
jgi:hypothetical protein